MYFKSKKFGFSLVEILIVIIIIMAVMSIMSGTFFTNGKKETVVSLKNISSAIRELAKSDNRKTLELTIFGSQCKKAVWTSEKNIVEIQNELNINTQSLETFKFNSFGEMEKVEYPMLRDGQGRSEKVCFKFNLFDNRSTSSFIVSEESKNNFKNKKFYVFRPYFKETLIFNSLEEATENYLNEEINPDVLE
jgi:type II secretory pathway pseudopilin PulG